MSIANPEFEARQLPVSEEWHALISAGTKRVKRGRMGFMAGTIASLDFADSLP
jgi:hypothetical protein